MNNNQIFEAITLMQITGVLLIVAIALALIYIEIKRRNDLKEKQLNNNK